MKFGQAFAHSQIHEWAQYYLPYRALKHIIEVELSRKNLSSHKIEVPPSELSDGISFKSFLVSKIGKMTMFARSKLSGQEERIEECLRLERGDDGCRYPYILPFLNVRYTHVHITRLRYKKKRGITIPYESLDVNIFNPEFTDKIDSKLCEIKELRDRTQKRRESIDASENILGPEAYELEDNGIQRFMQSLSDAKVSSDRYVDLLYSPFGSKSLNELSSYLYSALSKGVNEIAELIVSNFPEVICSVLHNDLSKRTIMHKIVKNCCLSDTHGTNKNYFVEKNLNNLRFLLYRVPTELAIKAIKSKDTSESTPLHIAVIRCGIVAAKLMIDILPEGSMDSVEWEDSNKHVPTFYAVVHNRHEIVRSFVESRVWTNLDYFSFPRDCSVSSELPKKQRLKSYDDRHASLSPLALSSYMGYSDVVSVLLRYGAEPNIKNSFSETPLHYCCRKGNLDCLNLLICNDSNEAPRADINIKETTKGRTPLFIAVINGKLDYVKRLLEAGAQVEIIDTSGLNPHEHAVFRAHYDIATFLSNYTAPIQIQPFNTVISKSAQAANFQHLNERVCLVNDKHVILTFEAGSCGETQAVRLNGVHAESLVNIFLLEMSSPYTDPKIAKITTHASDIIENVKFQVPYSTQELCFNFVIKSPMTTSETGYVVNDFVTIGSSSALLSLVTSSDTYKNTKDFVRIPILSSKGKHVGRVNFKYLVINPFPVSTVCSSTSPSFWEGGGLKLIGHRGSGMNPSLKNRVSTYRRFHLAENTLLSFVNAGNMGANYVEFDVQVTRDDIPVIHHDFRIIGTPSKPAINTISAAEFESFGPSSENKHGKYRGPMNCIYHRFAMLRRSKSTSSLAIATPEPNLELSDLQKITETNLDKQSISHQTPKINLPFTTLKRALTGVPLKLGFNIEIKYPNPKQCGFYNLHPAELNGFVDTILKVIAEYAGTRKICYSSFNSEVCMVLCAKQNIHPVFYLTDGGTTLLPDIHDTSLYSAVRFAMEAGCVGIVSHTIPLLAAPKLIHIVREKGLILMAYGPGSDELNKAKILKDYGIDGIITDGVADLSSLKL